MTAVLIALGAAIGAPARYLVDVALRRRLGAAFPWGTLCVNVVGSFVLGLVVGAEPGARMVALLGTGFSGAFTTYSAFALDTVSLPRGRAVLNVAANVGFGLGAAALGLVLV